jgi:hypothetical protein
MSAYCGDAGAPPVFVVLSISRPNGEDVGLKGTQSDGGPGIIRQACLNGKKVFGNCVTGSDISLPDLRQSFWEHSLADWSEKRPEE